MECPLWECSLLVVDRVEQEKADFLTQNPAMVLGVVEALDAVTWEARW